MNNGFYFAKEKDGGEVFTVYVSSTQNRVITDDGKDKNDLELLCPIPEKVVSSVLQNKMRLLNMSKLMERMHQ